jgi:uncharacterized membrane protein YccC
MSQNPPPVPIPPAPAPPQLLRGVIAVRGAGRRWPYALRAAMCMELPLLIGWVAGDVAAGLTVTVGAFTGLYGSGRPYLHRGVELAILAVSFA